MKAQKSHKHYECKVTAIKEGSQFAKDCRYWNGDHHVTDNGLRVEHNANPWKTQSLDRGVEHSGGRYKLLTSSSRHHELFIYRDMPDKIWRRDPRNPKCIPTLILEKVEGDWFPRVRLTDSELQSLKPFVGAVGISPDIAMGKQRLIKREGSRSNRGQSSFQKKVANQKGDRRVLSGVEIK